MVAGAFGGLPSTAQFLNGAGAEFSGELELEGQKQRPYGHLPRHLAQPEQRPADQASTKG